MRNAERLAKLKRERLWKDFVPSASKLEGETKFEGVVMEVRSFPPLPLLLLLLFSSSSYLDESSSFFLPRFQVPTQWW